jgi:hypothetical protein
VCGGRVTKSHLLCISVPPDQPGPSHVCQQLLPALVQLLGPLLRLLLHLPLLGFSLLALFDEILYPLLAGVAAAFLKLLVRPEKYTVLLDDIKKQAVLYLHFDRR